VCNDVTGLCVGPEERAVPVDNLQVLDDGFDELIGMQDINMDVYVSIKPPGVHGVHVVNKQPDDNTSGAPIKTKKTTPITIDTCDNTTTSGDLLANYHAGTPPEQLYHTHTPLEHQANILVQRKKTDKETDSEIQQMVREMQSSFDTFTTSSDNTTQNLCRKENTHFLSRFVM